MIQTSLFVNCSIRNPVNANESLIDRRLLALSRQTSLLHRVRDER